MVRVTSFFTAIGIANFAKIPENPHFASSTAGVYTTSRGLNGTRTLLTDPSGDILTIARGLQRIVALHEEPENSGTFTEHVLIDALGRNYNWSHGLTYRNNYVYVSSDIFVWRFPYTPGSRASVAVTNLEEVVFNMGAGGRGGAPLGHFTRTIVFGPDGYLYIGISSLDNVDPDSRRSRVRRVQWRSEWDTGRFPQSLDFENMQVWADGLRNPLAMAFDRSGRLWELDNGPDNLNRPDLGSIIYPDNPTEELNLLDGPSGTFYGYPQCFSVGNLTRPFGSDPDFMKQYSWGGDFISRFPDSWCQNPVNNRPPIFGLPAHSSPIQMHRFREEDGCGRKAGSWPCSMVGDMFATLHGSWNRPTLVGYSVVRIRFNSTDMPVGYEVVGETVSFQEHCTGTANRGSPKCFRPAGITFKDGIMFISSAVTGEIVRLAYDPNHVRSEVEKAAAFSPCVWVISLISFWVTLFF
jgi:glucose/arabinose dehydrogenase